MSGTFNAFKLVDGYQLNATDGYSYTSAFFDVSDKSLVSISVVFTGGSPAGTVKVQQSNDLQFTGGNSVLPLHIANTSYPNDTTDSVAIAGIGQVVSQSVSGAGSYPLELKLLGSHWLRIVYTASGNVNTQLDVFVTAKRS